MIRVVRRRVTQFLRLCPNVVIEGQPLSGLVTQASNMIITEYIEYVVLEQNEEARDIILLLAPLLFHVNLLILVFDSQDNTYVSDSKN